MSKLSLLALMLVSACRNNPRYCEGYYGNDCDYPWDSNGGSDTNHGCSSNAQCSAPTGVCDVSGTMTCVACIAPGQTDACTGTTPTCGTDHACHACTTHADCASNACLPDGSCGTDSNVAYVDPAGTDNTTCSKMMPCTMVAKALATNRAFVKFHGMTDEAVAVVGGRHVTFLADTGAQLTRSTGTGAIITVTDDGTELEVFDLAIKNAPNNPSGFGIAIPSASGAPTLSVTRSTISNNPGGGITASGGTVNVSSSTISGNSGGGITLSSSQFSIVNTFIAANGGGTSALGGLKFDNITTAGTHSLQFNTITANLGPATVNTGVNCGTVTIPITFDSNIIYGNSVSAGGKQLGGSANCLATYSDIGPDATTGTGNINANPMFVDLVGMNFHLTATSPCKDAANPAANLTTDFDGDTRPQGSGRDIGADEYK